MYILCLCSYLFYFHHTVSHISRCSLVTFMHAFICSVVSTNKQIKTNYIIGRTDQLRIIFRVFGKWTDLLARSLIQLPSERGFQQSDLPIPKIMMDGWHGPVRISYIYSIRSYLDPLIFLLVATLLQYSYTYYSSLTFSNSFIHSFVLSHNTFIIPIVI